MSSFKITIHHLFFENAAGQFACCQAIQNATMRLLSIKLDKTLLKISISFIFSIYEETFLFYVIFASFH